MERVSVLVGQRENLKLLFASILFIIVSCGGKFNYLKCNIVYTNIQSQFIFSYHNIT